MNISLEDNIRRIVDEQLDKRHLKDELIPVREFCEKHDVSRVTLWRAEREGKLQTTRIGRKVFINSSQFQK
jgi:hypothetical protein